MTTSELIAKLQRLDPEGTGRVEVPVRTFTQAYPVAYLEPYEVRGSPHSDNGVRICVAFDEGFSVSQRKKKG